MAMIKCPECGHAVSDKAPVCPCCGIEIAGHIIQCPQCGNIYLKNEPECPNCHHLTSQAQTALGTGRMATSPTPPASMPNRAASMESNGNHTSRNDASDGNDTYNGDNTQDDNDKGKSKKTRIVLISFILAVLVVAACYAVYSNAQNGKENEAYEYAMTSKDPMVLQSYLDTYKDAPVEHIDSIQAHLSQLRQMDQDWNNAVISGTKAALQQYIDQHPDSPFKSVAMHKIDSIDWTMAQSANTVEALEEYISSHPSGEYVDEANESIKNMNAKTVQPEERQMISGTFRNFFNALNNKDEDMLTSTVCPLMASFLNKPDATRSDVVTFMEKIYKGTVANMTWATTGTYTISKKEIGDEQYEYSVQFTAVQVVKNTDGTETKNVYRITAKVNPDSQISELGMKKVVE